MLFLLFAAAADAFTESPDQALALLTGVSARDYQWTAVLNTRLIIDRKAEPAKKVTEMLDRLTELEGQPTLRAQRVISHLVTDRGATGSELMFGVHALTTAVWCEMTNMVQKHAKYAAYYADKPTTDPELTRLFTSKIQDAIPGYVDKLAAMHEPFDHLQAFNKHVNDAITRFNESKETKGKGAILAAGLTAGFNASNKWYLQRCAVKPSPVSSGQPHKKPTDINVMKLIGSMESYNYVDFVTGMQGTSFWKDLLKIQPYVPRHNWPPTEGDDDEDVEEEDE